LHYISVDIEGMSGFRSGAERERNDRIMREHIRAAAGGLGEGGESDVLVKSFHGIPEGLPEHVRAVLERPPGEFDLPGLRGPPGLGAGCGGLVMLGFHGLGPEFAHGHAYRWPNLLLNGERCGEIAVQIILAATRGVPTVLLAGDAGAVTEARRYAPAALTVRTRPGRDADEGDMDEAVLDEIREAAAEAAARSGGTGLSELPPVFHLEAPMASALAADVAEELPCPVTRRGNTIGRESTDFADVYRFLLDLFGVCNEIAKRERAGD